LFYTYKVLRSNRLRSSILSDSVSDIGKFTTFERQVNLNADKKRLWFEKLRSIQEKKMIDSMAINLNYLWINTLYFLPFFLSLLYFFTSKEPIIINSIDGTQDCFGIIQWQ